MAAIGPVPSGRVELLSANLGPAAAATSMRGPSVARPDGGWRVVLGMEGSGVVDAASCYEAMNGDFWWIEPPMNHHEAMK